jgi:uncharacterized protein YgbK (DUF1537 family)
MLKINSQVPAARTGPMMNFVTAPAISLLRQFPGVAPAALVLADDLTGACDAGIGFAKRGLLTRVAFRPVAAESADVAILSSNTRTMPPSAALNRITELLQAAPRPEGVAFRKIDSTLRGNVVSECEAMLGALGFSYGVLAPSLPSQGRIVQNGALEVRDIAGAWSIDIPSLFQDQGAAIACLPTGQSSRELREAIEDEASRGARYILCDAVTEADLQTIAEALHVCSPPPLWIGSAGLADAAAAILAPHAARSSTAASHWSAAPDPSLLCIGSNHAVSSMQMAHLCSNTGVARLDASTAEPDEVRSALSQRSVAALCLDPATADPERIREQIRAATAAGLRRILLTGGDTAELICRAAGVNDLLVCGEALPGVAEGVVEGGLLDQVVFATKSGGFGQQDCLTRLLSPVPGSAETERA